MSLEESKEEESKVYENQSKIEVKEKKVKKKKEDERFFQRWRFKGLF